MVYAKHALIAIAVMIVTQLPLSSASRMTNCDYETMDWNGMLRTRAEYCMVINEGTVTEIFVGQRLERWVIEGAKAWRMSTAMSWDGSRWYHDRSHDAVIWAGSVKIDQLACRFRGKTTIRYVFSDDSAICLS